MVEESLAAADILFINSVTSAQISEMGKKCGLLFDPCNQPSSFKKLKEMEMQQCGGLAGSVSGSAA